MKEDTFRNLADFRIRFFGESKFEVIDCSLAAFAGKLPHAATVVFSDALNLFWGFALNSAHHEPHESFCDFTEEFFLCGAHGFLILTS